MSSVERASTAAAAMLCPVVRSATRAREPPLADDDGQPRCAAASCRCSGCRAWAAHATDGVRRPSAIKMGDN
eukprot:375642-Prymnesium_polylepis.1